MIYTDILGDTATVVTNEKEKTATRRKNFDRGHECQIPKPKSNNVNLRASTESVTLQGHTCEAPSQSHGIGIPHFLPHVTHIEDVAIQFPS